MTARVSFIVVGEIWILRKLRMTFFGDMIKKNQRHSEERSDEESKCYIISILHLLAWNYDKGMIWILRRASE